MNWLMASRVPIKAGMIIGPVINLAGGYLQSLMTGGVKGSSPTAAGNTNRPSPFAQILSGLQQLEQSNPPHYQEATNRK